MSEQVVTAKDYEPFCEEGRRVVVHLRAPAYYCMTDGRSVDMAGQLVQRPDPERLDDLVAAYRKDHDGDPSEETIDQWISEGMLRLVETAAPMPAVPVMMGELEVQGNLLVLTYRYEGQEHPAQVKKVIHPLDIKHVDFVDQRLIERP